MRASLAFFALVALATPALPPAQAATTQTPTATVDSVAGPGFCDGPAVPDLASARVGALAVDRAGRIFVAMGPAAAGLVVTVDESGRAGRLQLPPRVASRTLVADGEGGVVVAVGNRLVRVDRGNRPATLAVGSSAVLATAADGAGNLWTAEAGRPGPGPGRLRIRVLNRSTQPLVLAPGSPRQIAVSPGQAATVVTLAGRRPTMAVAAGRLYVAATVGSAGVVRLVNLGGAALVAHGVTLGPGEVDRVAGGGRQPVGEGVTGRRGALSSLAGIAADDAGNLFLADRSSHRVRRLDPAGTLATVAGSGQPAGDPGNDGPAIAARLRHPAGVAVGPGGRLYVSDPGTGQVRVVDHNGVIRAAPGAGLAREWKCLAGAAKAPPSEPPQPGGPVAVVAAPDGGVYLALADGHQIKRLDPSGRLTTVAGSSRRRRGCGGQGGCAGFRGDGGPAAKALLHTPTALALGARGALYVLDAGNARVRVVNIGRRPLAVHGVTVEPGAIATVAGTGSPGFRGDGGPALEAQLGGIELENPTSGLVDQLNFIAARAALGSLAVDGTGTLFVADPVNHRVRRVDPAGTITTFAGEAAPSPLDRCCRQPLDLAMDGAANLYVSDRGRAPPEFAFHPRVWFANRGSAPATVHGVTVAPGTVEAVAGNGAPGFGGDGGRAVDAQLLSPLGIAVDGKGDIYLAGGAGENDIDVDQQSLGQAGDVRRVDAAGTITLVAGNGQGGFNGDGLKGPLTSLNFPTDLTIDRCGDLLVADLGNDRVRRLRLAGTCPVRRVADGSPPASVNRASHGGRAALVLAVPVVAIVMAGIVRARRRRRSSPQP